MRHNASRKSHKAMLNSHPENRLYSRVMSGVEKGKKETFGGVVMKWAKKIAMNRKAKKVVRA